MPAQRYILFRARLDANGNPYLIGDPYAPGRYAGVQAKAEKIEDAEHESSHYEARAHVVLDHAHLRSEAAGGCGDVLGQCVAKSREEAEKTLVPAPAPKTTKPAAKGGDA